MNPYALWAVLIILSAVANLPLLICLLKPKENPMAVLAAFQPVLDELNASIAAVQALKDGAVSAQDVADTQAAVQTAADSLKAAVGT